MEFHVDGKTIYRYSMPAIGSNMYAILVDRQALVIDPHSSEEALALLRLTLFKKPPFF